jgi:alkylation response protein AidB-like acyl-CoA dehydrogenase
MHFAHSDEQDELRKVLRLFLADKAPLRAVRESAATELGYDPALWRQMSDQLGLPGLHLPEAYGGSGAGLVEAAVVMEETGRALSSAPYACSLLASLAVTRLGDSDDQARLLPSIASGNCVATLAMTETASATGVVGLQTVADRDGDHVVLTGTKTLVEHGHSADLLLVSARSGSAASGEVGLFVVSGDARGMTRTRQTALDITRPVAQVRLDGTPATPLGAAGADALDEVLDLSCALLASEMVGGIEATLEMSVAYAKQRHQFNRAIGSFQAVKHRLADVAIGLDGARALTQFAVLVAEQRGPELATAAPMAKAEASDVYTFTAGSMVQVLGGLGFTWEHDAHLFLRRAWADAGAFGSAPAQRARLADGLGL